MAREKGLGIIARVPLASGLLSGKFTKDWTFESSDHRLYNRDGQAFNVGETFGGLPFEKGVELVEGLRWMAEGRHNLAAASLQWVLQQKGVSTVIPGIKSLKQLEENLAALEVSSFSQEELDCLSSYYQDQVHQWIRGEY